METISYDQVKRCFDFLFSLTVLVVLSPLLVAVAGVIRVKLGKPVIYRQVRTGRNEKPFWMYKFRSMSDGKDEYGNLLPDEKRLSAFGKKLRSTSIDELPEFYNVLKGEMSVVGPRPLLMKYPPLYNSQQRRRHEVKPGITGWVQVNGRNTVSWEDRFKMDVWYIENRSFLLDMTILVRTITAVLRRDGITQRDHATVAEFMGNDK